ncbi:MAG: CNP1-like family protein [Azoarcus sp.]|nr:CNP1-like family protein [Azoarcus sp.]
MKTARVVVALAFLALTGCGAQEVKEAVVVSDEPPPLPEARNLVAFRVGSQPAGRFLVDTASIAPGADGVTRFVFVMRGSSGAEMASFEGVRCGSNEFRIFATSARGEEWRTLEHGEWRLLDGAVKNWVAFDYGGNDPRSVLAYHYLCNGEAPRVKSEILARLRGKHVDYLDPYHGVSP